MSPKVEDNREKPDFSKVAGMEFNDKRFPYRQAKRKAFALGASHGWDKAMEAMKAYARQEAEAAWEAGGDYEYLRYFGKVPCTMPDKATYLKERFGDSQ